MSHSSAGMAGGWGERISAIFTSSRCDQQCGIGGKKEFPRAIYSGSRDRRFFASALLNKREPNIHMT